MHTCSATSSNVVLRTTRRLVPVPTNVPPHRAALCTCPPSRPSTAPNRVSRAPRLVSRSLATTPRIKSAAPPPTTEESAGPTARPPTAANASPRRRVIFSGIQPTGVPHLGNYLGALKEWVRLQDEVHAANLAHAKVATSPPPLATSSSSAIPQTPPPPPPPPHSRRDELLFSIVGLHAITVPQDPRRLRTERRDMLAALLAVGLDPDKCTIFHQEQVPEHAELAWVLNCLAPVGRLRRMTTWKSKLAMVGAAATAADGGAMEQVDDANLHLGLFAYPVLQAADILLYRSTHVPVGEDQEQHLELTRDLADAFNRTFGKRLFARPQHMIAPAKRVLSLRDATTKMSKSSPDASSRILLTDSDEAVARKLRRAVTDERSELSYEPESRPGVANLLLIISELEGVGGGGGRGGVGVAGARSKRTPEEVARDLEATRRSSRDGGGGGSGEGPAGAGGDGGSGGGKLLKEAATEAVLSALRPVRAELERLKADPAYLASVESRGREAARQRASETMREVRRLVGFA